MNPDVLWNERLRLTAAWLNTLAALSVSIGAITPAVAVTYGTGLPNTDEGNQILLVGLGLWIGIGISLQWAARFLLRELRP